MTVETFTWCPRISATGEINYRIRKTQFGDGYAQVSGDGPNPEMQQHELTFTGTGDMVGQISIFLNRHQGWKSFIWQPPLGSTGLWRCESHRVTALGGDLFNLDTTFIQAFHP